MKHKIFFSVGILLCFSTLRSIAHAQEVNIDACRSAVHTEFAREQRLYRTVLYGQLSAENAEIGQVRFDTDGHPWIKTDEDEWSTVPNFGITIDNESMEISAELPPRRGIFGTRRVLTSELLPYAVQAVRTLSCRTNAICERMNVSLGEAPNDLPGCLSPEEIPEMAGLMDECRFPEANERIPDVLLLREECPEVARQLIQRETELLKLAVEYDAAYRSMLQFAGNFDLFLQELRWPLTTTLRRTVGLVGQLTRIPCFVSSCDSSPHP